MRSNTESPIWHRKVPTLIILMQAGITPHPPSPLRFPLGTNICTGSPLVCSPQLHLTGTTGAGADNRALDVTKKCPQESGFLFQKQKPKEAIFQFLKSIKSRDEMVFHLLLLNFWIRMSFPWMLTSWLWNLTLLEEKKGHIQLVEKHPQRAAAKLQIWPQPQLLEGSFILLLWGRIPLCVHVHCSLQKRKALDDPGGCLCKPPARWPPELLAPHLYSQE